MSVVEAKIQTVEDMYRLIWTAIANQQPISAIYKERYRLFCPHRLGRNRLGQPRVLCYQYGGESESGLAPIGSPENWRCIVFEKRKQVELLIEFGRFAAPNREKRGEGKPETFTFLGFTHFCGKRRKDGAFIVWRETAKKRLVAKLQAIKTELKHRRHEPIPSVGAWLRQVTSGYYQYHAVPGNLPRLQLFRWRLSWMWCRALSRRSQRSYISWDRLKRLMERWIPAPRVLHPYPMQRFDATHPRREPYA